MLIFFNFLLFLQNIFWDKIGHLRTSLSLLAVSWGDLWALWSELGSIGVPKGALGPQGHHKKRSRPLEYIYFGFGPGAPFEGRTRPERNQVHGLRFRFQQDARFGKHILTSAVCS